MNEARPVSLQRRLLRVAIVAVTVFGVGALFEYRWIRRLQPAPRATAAGEIGAATPTAQPPRLVAPLTPGATLGGFRVVGIGAVDAGVVRIDLVRGLRRAAVGIALAGDNSARAPVVVGPYALFYFGRDGSDLQPVLDALAAIVRAHATEPVPSGLRPLTGG